MNHEAAIDLLAEGFDLSCEIPNVTLVVLWGTTCCGVDTTWDIGTQFKVLSGLLDRGADVIGWLGLDENLDLIAVLPVAHHFDEAHQEVLLKAYETKTCRSAGAARRHYSQLREDFRHQHAPELEMTRLAQIEVEWSGFMEGMDARVRSGGRP